MITISETELNKCRYPFKSEELISTYWVEFKSDNEPSQEEFMSFTRCCSSGREWIAAYSGKSLSEMSHRKDVEVVPQLLDDAEAVDLLCGYLLDDQKHAYAMYLVENFAGNMT